jgi:hypothetical protein
VHGHPTAKTCDVEDPRDRNVRAGHEQLDVLASESARAGPPDRSSSELFDARPVALPPVRENDEFGRR